MVLVSPAYTCNSNDGIYWEKVILCASLELSAPHRFLLFFYIDPPEGAVERSLLRILSSQVLSPFYQNAVLVR